MSSFINLMASDVWSEADIKNRLHAEIRGEVSEQAETELNRALQGAALGMHTLTPQERVSLMAFKTVTNRVALLGAAARADAALLATVMELEVHARRLALPVVLADLAIDQGLVDADAAEREEAEAALVGASDPVLALLALRNSAVTAEGLLCVYQPPGVSDD
jgi:hypothetical protein